MTPLITLKVCSLVSCNCLCGCSFAGVQMKCYGYGGWENYNTCRVDHMVLFVFFGVWQLQSAFTFTVMEKGKLGVLLKKKENQKIWVLNIMRESRWQDHFWENYSLKDISVWKKAHQNVFNCFSSSTFRNKSTSQFTVKASSGIQIQHSFTFTGRWW